MENDSKTATPVAFLGTNPLCVYCGDPTPDMICPDCEKRVARQNADAAAKKDLERIQARKDAFAAKVGDYVHTEMTQLPETAAKRAAASYIIGSGGGLTISGPGNTGKTRSVVWIARKEMEAGRWAEFRQCGELRHEVSQHAKGGEWARGIAPLMRCDVLILDDFGNHEFTRTMEEFFLSVLEKRTNHGLRTFVTTQYTTDQIRGTDKPNGLTTTQQMADAILRRMGRAFATMVNTKDNTITPWK